MKEKQRYFSAHEVADLLGVSRQTAWRWMQLMPRLRRGKVVRVSEEALEQFIRQHTEYPTCLKGFGKRRAEEESTGTAPSPLPMEGECTVQRACVIG